MRVIAILGVNAALVVATQLEFRAWVQYQLGYFEFDMIGWSWHLWLPLTLLGTLLAALATKLRWAALATWATVGLLGLILVDHVLGALRDGSVEAPGAVVGVLMVLNVATLAAGPWIARSPRHAAQALAGVFLIVTAGALVAIGLQSVGPTSREAVVQGWLDAMEGEAEDRGWSHLDPTTQSWMNREAYVSAAETVRWDEVQWGVANVREYHEPGFWFATVAVEGGLASVPDFLFDQGFAGPACENGLEIGFYVDLVTPFFGPTRISAPSMTGGMERAAASRECP